jgi:hypothetical protein
MTSWEHLQNTNSRITQKINHFRKSVSANSKTVESSQYDFYIEDSRIQIIENDNFTTYTFFVVRDSPLPNILENYTYKAYNDGTYEQFLLKYHYTTHENGELIFDTDILEIETLNDEGIIFNRSGCLPEFVEVLNDVVCTHNTVCTSPDQHEVGDICFCGTTDPTCEPAGSLSCEYEYIWTYQGCGGGNSIPDPNDPGNNTGSGSNNDNPGYVLTPGVPVEDPRPIWEPITSCINGLKAIGQTDNTTIDTEILSQLNLSIAEWGVINNNLQNNNCSEQAQQETIEELLDLFIECVDNGNCSSSDCELIIDFEIGCSTLLIFEQDYKTRMSASEKQIFESMSRISQLGYLANAQKATWKSIELFPNSQRNGKRDAFRHAYWNALNVILLGDNLAESLASAHEDQPADYTYSYKETQMDLFNNEVGRSKHSWFFDGFSSLPDSILYSITNEELRYLSHLQGGASSGLATDQSQLIPTN